MRKIKVVVLLVQQLQHGFTKNAKVSPNLTVAHIPIRDKIETEILQYFINIKRNSHCCIIKQLVHHHIILRKYTSLHKNVQNIYLSGKESNSRP